MAAVRGQIAGFTLASLVFLVGSVLTAGAAPRPAAVNPPVDGSAVHDSVGELAGGLAALGLEVGTRVDPMPALAAARLRPALVTRLAGVVRQLQVCQDASNRLVAGLPAPPGELLRDNVVPTSPPPGTDDIRVCADELKVRGTELMHYLAAAPADQGSDLTLWPVLRLDLDGSDDTVDYDYMLSVDSGGNDTYLNNAGASLIDVRRGPPGSGAQSIQRARGCINPAYDLLAGECVISEALLVDTAGDDTYGHMEPPDPHLDGLCTADPLVRRVITGGVGSWGVGILLDGGGDDVYLGKSITLGAGHFGGVGMLIDESGDDRYSAIRLATGFGTLFGLGVFHDVAGNDTYSYYLPGALDPQAEDRTLGAGGALDTGGTCDKVSRWQEGSGFLGGVGVFFDDAGRDNYQVASPTLHEPGASNLLRSTGSLGFGDGGFGLFVDGAGADTYTGMPDRGDGKTVPPSDHSSGFFHDEGGGAATQPAAGPGGPAGASFTAWFTHYIPETVNVERGGTLEFFNPDLYGGPFGGRAHTITEVRSDGPPRFDVKVPWGTSATIGGVEGLDSGTYPFSCRIHPFMHGTLVVR